MRFKAPDLATAQHWANVLQVAGIGCELHNCYATGALGGLPADACTPELARRRTRRRTRTPAPRCRVARPSAGAAPWRCRQCGEALEAQFTACWQCGAVRDPLEDD